MSHPSQQEFCNKIKQQYPEYFKNKKILDIGSLDINGNNRDLFDESTYIGTYDLGYNNHPKLIFGG